MSRQDGFTLIELAVVLVIAGVMIGAAIAGMRPYLEYAQYNTTRMKMNNIADALALYAQNYNRLPCPADPDPTGPEPLGAPRGSGADGDEIDNDCGGTEADHIGIVPWRALGLGREQVLDGFGNALTYAVSPVLAGSTDGFEDNVHPLCRIQDIWVDTVAMPPINISPGKARFCCPRYIAASASRNLEILDQRTGGKSLYSIVQNTSGYNNLDSAVSASSLGDPNNRKNSIIAFALISHGKNGDGAYVIGTNNTMRVTAPADAEESENYNEDRTFVSRERSTRNNDEFFDDVVIWRTNHQLYSAFGNNSCTRP